MIDDLRNGQAGGIIRLQENYREHERRITRLESEYIHKNQFQPIERLVYGLTAAILFGVVGALLKLVVGVP